MPRFLIVIFVLLSGVVHAQERRADILTALTVTYMLVQQLTLDTELTVHNLAPARYGMDRLPGWFAQQGTEQLAGYAKGATAVITLDSVWPADPLYLHSRVNNIQVVKIDAGQALLPNGQSVLTLHLEDGV